MIFALKKKRKESDAGSCYYVALVQPIIVSLYISCTACDLTKPRCPIWNFGQNLNSMPGMNLDFMPGMEFSKFHARHEIEPSNF